MTATLSEAIPEFLNSRKANGVKASSLRNEKVVLNQLLASVGNILVKNITSVHIDRYFSSYPHLAPSTWNRNTGYLNVFFKWCRGRRYVHRDFDPLEGTRRRSVIPRDFIFVPVERFPELLNAAKCARDRAVIAIGLYSFQRASELNRLTWDDIEYSHPEPKQWRMAVYRQKTEDRDYLPLPLELKEELHRWRVEYGRIMGTPVQGHWYVAPAYQHGDWGHGPDGKLRRIGEPKLNPGRRFHAPQKAVQFALSAIGYEDFSHEGAHTLRRSGGMALYQELAWNRGHDGALRIVQSMYGHKSLATTERYLRLTLERKRRNDLLSGETMFPARKAEVASMLSTQEG